MHRHVHVHRDTVHICTVTDTQTYVHVDKTQTCMCVCGTAWPVALTPELQAKRPRAMPLLTAPWHCASQTLSRWKVESGPLYVTERCRPGRRALPVHTSISRLSQLALLLQLVSVLVVYLLPGINCMVPCKLILGLTTEPQPSALEVLLKADPWFTHRLHIAVPTNSIAA